MTEIGTGVSVWGRVRATWRQALVEWRLFRAAKHIDRAIDLVDAAERPDLLKALLPFLDTMAGDFDNGDEPQDTAEAITLEDTDRGFGQGEFTDLYGVICSIQKSSLATADAIWIGASEIGLKKFVPHQGWQDVETPNERPGGICYSANTRMHLDRARVAALLPLLQRFVETGDLR